MSMNNWMSAKFDVHIERASFSALKKLEPCSMSHKGLKSPNIQQCMHARIVDCTFGRFNTLNVSSNWPCEHL